MESIRYELNQNTQYICINLSNNKNKTILDIFTKSMPLLLKSSASSVPRNMIPWEK